MNEETFIKTVAPKIGGSNAIAQLNPVQQGALIDLLVEKGVITRAELEKKTNAGFSKLADMIAKMPVPSPLQNL